MDFKQSFHEADTAEGGGSFALIPEGEYEAEIVECKLDMSKTPARISLTYELLNGEFAGRKLWGNYQLGGQGLGYLKKDLNTLGISFANVGSEEDIAQLFWDNIPTQVVVFVNQKEWQRKTYNNVYLNEIIEDSAASVASAPAPAATPTPPQTTRAQTTRTPPAPAAGKTTAPKAGARGKRGGKDEIPF